MKGTPMTSTRTESDSFGQIDVPADALWGGQTERSRRFFAIGRQRMPLAIVQALAEIKRAAAEVNRDLGLLDPAKANAIAAAAARVAAGEFDDQFPLSVWQTGSGTQSNMNVNEVVARLASDALGGDASAARRRAPERRRQLGPVVERRVSDGDAHRRGARSRGRCWTRWRNCAARSRPRRPHSPTSSRSAAPTCRTPRRSRSARSSAATTPSWPGRRGAAAGAARRACAGHRRHGRRHRAEHAPRFGPRVAAALAERAGRAVRGGRQPVRRDGRARAAGRPAWRAQDAGQWRSTRSPTTSG
jgi:hypothetical protein